MFGVCSFGGFEGLGLAAPILRLHVNRGFRFEIMRFRIADAMLRFQGSCNVPIWGLQGDP